MRVKVLMSIDPDVLELIDARARSYRMTRSGFIAAMALGLIDHDVVEHGEDCPCDTCFRARSKP